MPLPPALLTPHPAIRVVITALITTLIAGLAVAGHRPDAAAHWIENPPQGRDDAPESRALTRLLQGLIQAHARRQGVCLAAAQPAEAAVADPCGSRWVQVARGDPDALRDLARSVDAPGGGSLARPGGFASQRLWQQVGDDAALYRLTAATYLLLPGTPDGQAGALIGQAAALAADADGLLAHDQQLIALRQARPSVARGSGERAVALGATLSFQRRLGAELSLATYNYGHAPARLTVTGLPAGARLQALLPRATAALRADAQGRASVPLAAQSFVVWQVLGAGTR